MARRCARPAIRYRLHWTGPFDVPLITQSDRYIGAQVVRATVLTLVTFTLIDGLFDFASELEDIGQGRYDMFRASIYTALTLPGRLSEWVEVAVLFGGLLGLGGLASHRELIALQTGGVSIVRIGAAAGGAVLLLTVSTSLVEEWVAPAAERSALQLRARAQADQAVAPLGEDIWLRDGDRFMQVGELIGRRYGRDVTIYEFDRDRRLTRVIQAQGLVRQAEAWAIRDARVLDLSDERVERSRHAHLRLPSQTRPDIFRLMAVEPDAMAMRELWGYVRYLETHQLASTPYRLALWIEAFKPLSALTAILLCLPFVIGPLRGGGMGVRIALGLLLGLVYLLIARFSTAAGQVLGLPPVASAGLPPAALGGAALVLLARIR